MQGRYGDLDYPWLTKASFLLGLGMFVGAELAEFGLRTAGLPVLPWEHSLLMIVAAVGIIVGLLSRFVFGILLPLTE